MLLLIIAKNGSCRCCVSESRVEFSAITLYFLGIGRVEALSLHHSPEEFHIFIVLRLRSRHEVGRGEAPMLFWIDMDVPDVRTQACNQPSLLVAIETELLNERIERTGRDREKLRLTKP